MVEISLTDFVDFASKAGTSRMTAVRDLKSRPTEYHPKRDYYKDLREFIQELHRGTANDDDFAKLLAGIRDQSKISHFEAVFSGHGRFVGLRTLGFFEPLYKKWNYAELIVRVNPELGLVIDDVPHLIKLYFKSDPLSKQKTDVIAHLMEVALRKKAPQGTVMGVLDLRRGKLHAPTVPIAGLDVLLASEAMAFMQLWNGL